MTDTKVETSSKSVLPTEKELETKMEAMSVSVSSSVEKKEDGDKSFGDPESATLEDGTKVKIDPVTGLASKIDDGEIYDEVEIEDMEFDEDAGVFYYPCPCGDKFAITEEELMNGEDIATCPSCTLKIRVIYDIEDFEEVDED